MAGAAVHSCVWAGRAGAGTTSGWQLEKIPEHSSPANPILAQNFTFAPAFKVEVDLARQGTNPRGGYKLLALTWAT